MSRLGAFVVLAAILGLVACGDEATGGGSAGAGGDSPEARFSFFVTSVGSGASGGNLGGLAGADQICENLAAAVGAGDRTWRAYLSTSTVDARDRIGSGPWYNQRLQEIAPDVDSLHENEIPRLLWNTTEDPNEEGLVIDENGSLVPLAEHDIMTGSEKDGTVWEGRTCLDWTSASEDEAAQVGHSDIEPPGTMIGGPDRLSWNSAHDSASCTEPGLVARFGSGRFYCFAID